MVCVKCQKNISDFSDFCCHCGTKVVPQFCDDIVTTYYDGDREFDAQIEEFKIARRRWRVRLVTALTVMALGFILVLLSFDIHSLRRFGMTFLEWCVLAPPLACWLSCLTAKMLEKGILPLLKTIGQMILSVILDIFGSIKLIISLIGGLVVALFIAAIFSKITVVILIILYYYGVYLAVRDGIKEKMIMKMYHDIFVDSHHPDVDSQERSAQ